MTTTSVTNNGTKNLRFTTQVTGAEKQEFKKVTQGQNWKIFDLNFDGKLDKEEVTNAIMTYTAELEEGNVDIFGGENEYNEFLTEKGELITITKAPDGKTIKCKYDKNDNMIEEVITDKKGKTQTYKYKYDKETGMILK